MFGNVVECRLSNMLTATRKDGVEIKVRRAHGVLLDKNLGL